MNWQIIVTSIGTFVLGIGVVWKFLGKFTPHAKRYIGVAKESLDLLDTVLKAVEDQKIDTIEVEAIRKEAEELIKILGKK